VGAPTLGSLAPASEELSGVRRAFMRRTRYHVYYRLRGDDLIEILAVWHTSRGEGPGLK
jgi:plasmid stabilization system protein ParE